MRDDAVKDSRVAAVALAVGTMTPQRHALASVATMKICNSPIYRYQPGFLHQKVWLIDDYASIVGTANLDNRD